MIKQIFLILILFSLCSNITAQDKDQLKKQIDKIIHYDTEIKWSDTPGMIIGVKYQDSIYYFSYGTTSKETDNVPNENTLFEIGGLTKAFTGSLVSLLVNEGEMNYEDALNNYLPTQLQNEELQLLTIDQLVTHTSKLPRMPMEFGVKELEDNNPYAHYTKKDLMEFYKEYIPIELKKKKRKKKKNKDNYAYSHLNYALLESAIEASQRQHYETILADKILNPLGLKDTRVRLSEEQQSRLAVGYSTSGQSTPPWKFKSFQASEGLKSTAKDLIKFAEVHMGNDNSLLTKAFVQTHLGQKETGLNKRVKSSRGWHVITTNKKHDDIIAHTGNTNGYRSYLAFVKESNTAVVILTNSEHNLQNLGYLILSMINNYWKK